MREVVFTASVISSGRTVGGGAGSEAPANEQWSPHGFLQRIVRRCSRYRYATLAPDAMTRRTLAACNVARYSES